MGALREIFVKAVCARGKDTFQRTHRFRTKYHPDEILGCRVTNHRCHGEYEDGKVQVRGRYDLHVWYAYRGVGEEEAGRTHTAVAVHPFEYHQVLSVEHLTGDPRGIANPQVRLSLLRPARCRGAAVDADGVIQVTVEDAYAAEVIGETTLWVPVYAGVTGEHSPDDKDKDLNLWESLTDEEDALDEELWDDDFEEDLDEDGHADAESHPARSATEA